MSLTAWPPNKKSGSAVNETSDNPSAASWRLRCLHDDGSERRRLLCRRCLPSGLRRTSCRCRPTSGRRGSTSSRCSSCCRRSAPQGLLTIAIGSEYSELSSEEVSINGRLSHDHRISIESRLGAAFLLSNSVSAMLVHGTERNSACIWAMSVTGGRADMPGRRPDFRV